MRHREARAGHDGWETTGAHHARDFEQLIGVVGAGGSRRKHQVVACPFTLRSNATCRHPRERVEPVERARELREHVREAIAALHVRELVEQHDAQPVLRPLVRGGGHHDRRPPHSPRHGHGRASAAAEADAGNSQVLRELTCERQPGGILDRLGAPRDHLHGDEAKHQPSEHERRASAPEHQHGGRRSPALQGWTVVALQSVPWGSLAGADVVSLLRSTARACSDAAICCDASSRVRAST